MGISYRASVFVGTFAPVESEIGERLSVTDDAPVAKPLELRDDAGPARELPNGRGFLRLVGAPSVAPSRSAPRPVQASPVEATPVAPVALAEVPPPAQGDLFEWAAKRPAKPMPLGQLSLFGEEGEK